MVLPKFLGRSFSYRSVWSGVSRGTEHLKVIEFKDYRKYSADAIFSFEKQ